MRHAFLAALVSAALLMPDCSRAQTPQAGGNGTSSVPAAKIPPSQRWPLLTDDSAHGYTMNDVWQQGGNLLLPSAVMPGGAVWSPALTQSGGLPVDILGATTRVACGTVALKAGYTGPAYDVQTTVGGATVTTTINILATGRDDDARLMAVLAAEDPGTVGTVSRCYDQTGLGNDLVPSPGVMGPQVGRVKIHGFNTFSWGYNQGPAGLAIPSAVTFGSAFQVYMAGRMIASASAPNLAVDTGPSILFEIGNTANNGNGSIFFLWNNASGLTTNNRVSGNNNLFPCGVMLQTSPGVLSFTVPGAPAFPTVMSDEDSSSCPLGGSQASSVSGGNIGNTGFVPGDYGGYAMIAFLADNAVPSAAQQAAVRRGLYVRLDLAPQVKDRVVVIGDSRSLQPDR